MRGSGVDVRVSISNLPMSGRDACVTAAAVVTARNTACLSTPYAIIPAWMFPCRFMHAAVAAALRLRPAWG